MKIVILGFDQEGRSSYEYFKAQGHELAIRDQNPNLSVPEGVPHVLGEAYLNGLDQFDLLVRTAGLAPKKILDKNPGVAGKITTHINEFLKACPTKQIIGITGTKGKGTTSTLIARMLEAAGKQVYLGGNIGVTVLDWLPQLSADDWVVLELSSFQLIDVQRSPPIAVCLMVVPEHLNWHLTMEEYVASKAQLFAHQTGNDTAIYYAGSELSKQIASAGNGRLVPYYATPGAEVIEGTIWLDGQSVCRTDELKLLGKHNWQNACAAVTAVAQVTDNITAMRSVLTSFSGLEHRLELVRELHGVQYYDDSFGTAPETAMVAIEAFEQPVIAILGGRGKDIPFDALAAFVAGHPNAKQVITIGETGPEIAGLLRQHGFDHITEGADTIEAIVKQAQSLAEPGDVVLLSTAATSFDMFKNYKQRGEQFTAAVRSLSANGE